MEDRRGPMVLGPKDQDISNSFSNTSLTLKKVHLVQPSKSQFRNKRSIADLKISVHYHHPPAHQQQLLKAGRMRSFTFFQLTIQTNDIFHLNFQNSKTINNWRSCQNSLSSSLTLEQLLLICVP